MGTITIINGDINAAKYKNIIENNVWQVIARNFANNDYQNDNVPVHRAPSIKEYIDQMNWIKWMEWPAKSPNLNIIENVWWRLKIELQKQADNITSVAVLEGAIRNIWIEIVNIKNLYNSMPKRIQPVEGKLRPKETIVNNNNQIIINIFL